MRQLTISDVAEMVGVKVATIRAHRARSTMPEPSGYLGDKPFWSEAVIAKWMADRPRQGRPVKPVKPVKPSWRYQRKVTQ
jgi:predicted DNA-binding transcriptional regulator AlpA